MKKLIKGIVVVALAAVMLCTTNVMAGKVGFSTTLSSDKKKIDYEYSPDGGTFQVIYLTGFQYHSGSKDYYEMEKGDVNHTHRYYGAGKCKGTFTALTGYVYKTVYEDNRLTLTITTDNVERGVLYPQ